MDCRSVTSWGGGAQMKGHAEFKFPHNRIVGGVLDRFCPSSPLVDGGGVGPRQRFAPPPGRWPDTIPPATRTPPDTPPPIFTLLSRVMGWDTPARSLKKERGGWGVQGGLGQTTEGGPLFGCVCFGNTKGPRKASGPRG